MNEISIPPPGLAHPEGGGLRQRLRLHAPDVADHMIRVRDLALRVAAAAGLSSSQRRTVGLAAGVHDVGKLGVPWRVLEKPGPLSPHERRLVQQHSVVGARLLLADVRLAPVAGVVRAVHERWDGRGYPDGLGGEEIPVEARVIAVCDAWDAMTQWRSYRVPLRGTMALAELDRGAGSQFDPVMVEALSGLVTGTWCVE
jgi:HD-GYP domain-containing protein (c-di-GMP phosphodiesterase class II)